MISAKMVVERAKPAANDGSSGVGCDEIGSRRRFYSGYLGTNQRSVR